MFDVVVRFLTFVDSFASINHERHRHEQRKDLFRRPAQERVVTSPHHSTHNTPRDTVTSPARPVHDVADVGPGHGDAEEAVPDAHHCVHRQEVVVEIVGDGVDN